MLVRGSCGQLTLLNFVELCFSIDEQWTIGGVATFQFVSPLFLLMTCVSKIIPQQIASPIHQWCVLFIRAGDGAGVHAQRQEDWQTDLRSDAHILAPHASLWHHQIQDLHPRGLGPCEWKKTKLNWDTCVQSRSIAIWVRLSFFRIGFVDPLSSSILMGFCCSFLEWHPGSFSFWELLCAVCVGAGAGGVGGDTRATQN